MTEVRSPNGRLVTFRVIPPVEDARAAEVAVELRSAIVAIPGPVVVCADLSAARTFSQPTTERFVALMRSDNAKLERSAVLLGAQSATFALQVERMVKEANHDGRRTFRDRAALSEWLAAVLNPAEQRALEDFFAR